MINLTQKLRAQLGPAPKRGRVSAEVKAEIERVTEVSAEAPAPRLQAMVESRGAELTQAALNAWEARKRGDPVVNIAHGMNVSIETAKALIREAFNAVSEDLKETVAINRELDLQRIDAIVKTYLEPAAEGHLDSAKIVLAAVNARSKLLGADKLPDPARGQQPAVILAWIQAQLPNINRIVEAQPIE
jgi:hypothetical protein